jgi:hypothetical protein
MVLGSKKGVTAGLSFSAMQELGGRDQGAYVRAPNQTPSSKLGNFKPSG